MAKKVVIDAGHGGTDPGTSGNGIIEKDKNLEISNYIHNRLDELGIDNEMTRTTDETLTSSDRPSRAQSFYGTGSDVIVLSNHINAGGGDGAEVIYALRNDDTLASLIAEELIISGQNVRKYYQRRLPSDPSKDYYYMLRDTADNESLIVEYGFVDSTEDDVSQLINDWEDLAEAVVRALAEYIGVTYTSGSADVLTYTVKSGDTLWSIAKSYGISVDELKEYNGLTSNSLSINQIILIPESEDEESEYYTVVKGDTLYSIALKYGLTVDELKSLNSLTSNLLSIGQKLLVSANDETYTVKSGDNLYKIATAYGITVSNLMSYNNLTSTLLSVGQVLKIPSTSESEVYTVVAGDTLWSIANKYNTTVSAIMNANSLSTNLLSIGQKLIIP